MSKKFAVMLSALLSVFTAGLVCGCGTSKPSEKPEPKRPETGHVVLSGNDETVWWDPVDGAASYDVSVADGRFGEYESKAKNISGAYYTYSNGRYKYYRIDASDKDGNLIDSSVYSYEIDLFGDNVRVYSPADSQEAVQSDIDAVRNATGQFSNVRYTALFKPGEYADLDLVMRYYMTFAGLGEYPTDVTLGKFNTHGELAGGNATCNFWCGIENVTVDDTVQWAVSQATSFRRMKVNGGMYLTDRNGNKAWGSGGFIADTVVTGTLNSGNQQQWLTRNSQWNKWQNCDINMVYSGCNGKFASSEYEWPTKRITWLDKTDVMREKPFLIFVDDYYVYLPQVKHNTKDVSWGMEELDGEYLPISDFYVAKSETDDAKSLNAALDRGLHLLFTPGIYEIDEPITIKNPDTVVMGMGLATLKLTDKNTDTAVRISDVDGVSVSGLMLDAGKHSATLMEIGSEKSGVSHADDPIVLNDVYFRIGGAVAEDTSVDTALVINSADVVGDNFWVWRADHGSGVGWDNNRATNGVIVNGDNVTVYGLMVEHFQEYQTVWNGENGKVVFYQSETPYDPPEQSAWKSVWNGREYNGWASYKVSDHVQTHTAQGIGVYYVASSRLRNVFDLDHGIELPSNPGIRAEHMAIANFLTYGGGIAHIVNSYGDPVTANGQKKQFTSFVAGLATP